MADSTIGVTPPASPSTLLDATSLTVSAQTVLRERLNVAGRGATELMDVRAVAPLSTDFGSVVRPLVAPVPVHANATLTTTGSAILATNAFPDQQLSLIVNVKNSPTGTTPTITFTVQEVDPGDGATVFGTVATTQSINAIGVFTCALQSMVGNQVKVSWTVTGATPSFTGLYATLVGKTTPGVVSTQPVSSVTSSSPAQQTVGTSSGSILASNVNRKRATVVNTGVTTIYLGLGQTPTVTAYHVALSGCSNGANDGTGGVYESEFWDGAINAISSAASGTVCVAEIT